MREVYELPETVYPNSKIVEELAKEGIEVVSLEPFVVYVRSDMLHRFPSESALRAYVLNKLKEVTG